MYEEHVILLHGLCRTSQSMRHIADELSLVGFRVHNIDYPSRLWTIEHLSEQVVGPAMRQARDDGAKLVHFVTHSMGGILVRHFAHRHPDVAVGRVVMLGPPNQGSEVVDRLRSWKLFQRLNGPAGSQLGTDPHSIPNLLGRVPFEAGVIAGRRSINLINSYWIEGPDDGKVSVSRTRVEGMKDHVVLPVAHPFIMRDRRAIRPTIQFLKEGDFGALEAPVVRPNQSLEPMARSSTPRAEHESCRLSPWLTIKR